MASVERRRDRPTLPWRARYRDPVGRQRSRSFARKVDAERFLTEIEAAKLAGRYVDPRLGRTRFGVLAERWWSATADLKPSTRNTYRKLLDGHVLPAFGQAQVAGVDRLAVTEWLAAMLGRGVSATRARDAYRVLRLVLEAGIAGGLLVSNPAAGVRLPRVRPRDGCSLTAVEVDRLAQAIHAPYGVLVHTAAYSGMRAGELAALTVRRLDLLGGRVDVVESTTEVAGKLLTGPTKSYARRTVRLPRSLCEELGAYLAGRPSDRDALVFTMPAGGPLRQSMIASRYFKPAVHAAGLDPRLRFHDLRHTCASLLIAQGATVKAVQAQLGHASATVTLDRYGHLFPDELDHLTERLDRARAGVHSEPVWPTGGPTVIDLEARGG